VLSVLVLVMNFLVLGEQRMDMIEAVVDNLVLEAGEDIQEVEDHTLEVGEGMQVDLDILETEEKIQVGLFAEEHIPGNLVVVVDCKLASFQEHCFDKAHLEQQSDYFGEVGNLGTVVNCCYFQDWESEGFSCHHLGMVEKTFSVDISVT